MSRSNVVDWNEDYKEEDLNEEYYKEGYHNEEVRKVADSNVEDGDDAFLFVPQLSIFFPAQYPVVSSRFVPANGRVIMSATQDGLICSHDILTGNLILIYSRPCSVPLDTNGQNIFEDKYFMNKNSFANNLPGGFDSLKAKCICTLAFSREAGSPCFSVAYENGDINVFDYRFCQRNEPCIMLRQAHDGAICGVEIGVGDNPYTLISGGRQDGWIRWWDLRNPVFKCCHISKSVDKTKTCATCSIAQPFAAICPSRKRRSCINDQNMHSLQSCNEAKSSDSTTRLHNGEVLSLDVSTDGRILCCATGDGQLAVYRIPGMRLLKCWFLENGTVLDRVIFSGNDKYVLTAGRNFDGSSKFSCHLVNLVDANQTVCLKMPPDSVSVVENKYFMVSERNNTINRGEVENNEFSKKGYELFDWTSASPLEIHTHNSALVQDLCRRFWANEKKMLNPEVGGNLGEQAFEIQVKEKHEVKNKGEDERLHYLRIYEKTEKDQIYEEKHKEHGSMKTVVGQIRCGRCRYWGINPQQSEYYSRVGENSAPFGRYDLYNEPFVCTPWRGNHVVGTGGSNLFPGLHVWDADSGCCLNTAQFAPASRLLVRCISPHFDLSTYILLTGGSLPVSIERKSSNGNASKRPAVTIWSAVRLNNLLEDSFDSCPLVTVNST